MFPCSLMKFIWFLLCITAVTSKLSLPRVLLPSLKSVATNYTMKIPDDGCYKWTLSRLDIIQIIHLDEDKDLHCSSEVILSTITKEFTKNSVVVLVEDIVTHEVLRFDVIFNTISSLNIITKSRQIIVEESPEIFELRAYDDQGNEFSTLEGLEFTWSIVSGKGNNFGLNYAVLRLMNFRDSQYYIPNSIKELDSRGLTGYMIFLEGVRTGTASISATLNYPEYRHIKSATVQVDVIAKLIVEPTDVYVLPGDVVEYKLYQIKHGRFIEVKLPSTQYSLGIEDKNIARQPVPWSVETLIEGQTKLVLIDINSNSTNDDDESSYLPWVTLNVVKPVHLQLALLPYRNWITTVHKENSIVAELYDGGNHKIYIGPHVLIKMKVNSTFDVAHVTRNGSFITGYATQSGTIRVLAEFDRVIKDDRTVINFNRIVAEAEMTVYPGLQISPPDLVIAWDPVESHKFEFLLRVSGGDDHYMWSTSNDRMALVTKDGVVRPRGIGSCNIIAAMQMNPTIQAVSNIEIVHPTRLEVVHNTFEAEIGSAIVLELALYHDTKTSIRTVTDCTRFPFKVDIDSVHFKYRLATEQRSSIKDAVHSKSCTILQVFGDKVAQANVSVSYITASGKLLAVTAPVSTFDPLRLITPDNGKTVLSVGAQRHIVFSGGPSTTAFHQLTEQPADAVRATLDDKIASVEQIASVGSAHRVYLVTCHDIGNTVLEVDVFKQSQTTTATSEYPQRVEIVCAHPKVIKLSVEAGMGNSAAIPECQSVTAFKLKNIALNDRQLTLRVTVLDEHGNVFDNATSVEVKWSSSNAEIATIRYQGMLRLKLHDKSTQSGADYSIPLYHYQVVVPTSTKGGELTVTARMLSYRKPWLQRLGISLESLRQKIWKIPDAEATLRLAFVPALQLSTDQLSVFNHPSNVAKLYVTHGSGRYEITSTAVGQDVARITYVDATRTLEVAPLQPANFVITVRDLCMRQADAVSVTVRILSVDRVQVNVIDKVQKGSEIVAHVQLFDTDGNVVLNRDLVNLKGETDNSIVVAECDGQVIERNSDYVECVIRGVEIGYTNVVFSAGLESVPVRSDPVRIQVYAPLQILPSRDITLIPGAVIQLTVKGGPLQPDCQIEYVVEEEFVGGDGEEQKEVAVELIGTVNSGSVRARKLGENWVVAKAVGVNAVTGERIVYSSDRARLTVVHLTGVRVKSSIKRMSVGTEMALWIEGVPEQINPLVLASVSPSALTYAWDVSPPSLGRVSHLFEDVGIKVSDKDKIAMRFYALKPGSVTINVRVSVPEEVAPAGHRGKFFDSITINVFESLHVHHFPYAPMLLGPNVKYQLKTNKDDDCGQPAGYTA